MECECDAVRRSIVDGVVWIRLCGCACTFSFITVECRVKALIGPNLREFKLLVIKQVA